MSAAVHTTRESWLQAFIEASRPLFIEAGAPLPETIRISIGWPSKGTRSKVIGECWRFEASTDGVCEIFIRPSLQSEVSRIAGVTTHELIHAAWGHDEGHGRNFGKTARALGLEGKLTATTQGPGWFELHQPILDALGPFPGAGLNSDLSGKKKQTTRLIKVECDKCGWHFRASQQNVDRIVFYTCLACGEGQLGVAS